MENEFLNENLDEEKICPVNDDLNDEDTENKISQLNHDQSAENVDSVEEQPAEKKAKWWKIALAIACCVALLASLAVVILQGMGIDLRPRENNVSYKDSYYVTDKEAVKKADKVVAELGDRKLTNAELQIMYWMQIDEFLRYYGDTYFDYTKPLNEQLVSEQSGLSWQQYFIEMSINMWQRYQILAILAENGKYESINKYRETLDQVYKDLDDMAKENDFENADAMIQKDMGAACTAEDYVRYLELRNVGMLFLSEKYEELEPDEKTIGEYFTEHEAEFKQSGITKESGSLVDVRHILVQLDDVKAESNGKVNYTDDQWAQCMKNAEDLLDKWKSGEATEETFAELANANSKDGGSNTNGGLYQQVAKGTMVEAFDAWIFDASRTRGDTGIVKTEFGYHIMYFVDIEAKWVTAAKTGYLSDRVDEMVAEGEKNYPISINFKKIALTDIYG